MENLSDAQLVALYLDGNHKAFDGLINRYSQPIYRWSLKMLSSPDDAHDVTQEAFIQAWKHLKKYDPKRSFKAWLFAIARNKMVDIARKRKLILFTDLNTPESDIAFEETVPDENLLPDEIFENNERIGIVQKALETLSIDDRTIILLHHGEDMTFEEIAEVQNKPMNTVKSRYRRALIALRTFINTALHQNAEH